MALLLNYFSNAQIQPSFSWVKGLNTANALATYGTQGISDVNNVPGARENAMTWVDSSGRCWLFGGHGYTSGTSQTYLNDLWRYDPSTNEWAWISGSNSGNSHGAYGTLGLPSATNTPGARQNGYTWTDANGNLWLFGGNGFATAGALSYLNDLWKFNVSTNEWTWISGSNTMNATGIYGTQGTPSSSNIPGARFGGNAWTDNNGNLWLFGGQENHGAVERLNDLWKYNINANEWCWMKGSNQTNQNGVYGTKGVASALNTPGSRQACVSWTDGANQFWMFGGYGFPETGSSYSYLNDLWKYDVNTNQWTWMSGSNLTNQTGSYGTKGVSSSSNIPGARQMSIGWYESTGNFWLFGCWGYSGPLFGRLNDLWQYNIASNMWTWFAGSNTVDQPGVYGTIGIGSTTHIPGSRRMSVSFKALNGDMYLFGGNGYDGLDSLGLMNDLWKISAGSLLGISHTPEYHTSMTVYPTQCVNTLFIRMEDGLLHELKVLDAIGHALSKTRILQSGILDLSGLKRGWYFLVCDEDNARAQRFFKE